MKNLPGISKQDMKNILLIACVVTAFVMVFALDAGTLTVHAAKDSGSVKLDSVTSPIINLINSFIAPLIALVGAVGTLYCIFLGVKFAKAEEPQEREKAKAHLRNAIIGFVLIFVLIVAMRQMLPIMEQWMSSNMG